MHGNLSFLHTFVLAITAFRSLLTAAQPLQDPEEPG